jgi:hypothetical protein
VSSPAENKDKNQRYHAESLGQRCVVKRNAPGTLLAKQHPDSQEQQQGGHAQAHRTLADQNADDKQRGYKQ